MTDSETKTTSENSEQRRRRLVEVAQLDADGDLSALPALLEARGWHARDTLFVFDFDLTLSHLPIVRTRLNKLVRSVRAELRGGEPTRDALASLHAAGARCAILTAKVDSAGGVDAVRAKLRALALEPFFAAEQAAPEAQEAEAEADARLLAAATRAQLRCAARGDLLGSGHNKPEVFWLWAASRRIADRPHIVYVEDCADHVLNFYKGAERVFARPMRGSSSKSSGGEGVKSGEKELGTDGVQGEATTTVAAPLPTTETKDTTESDAETTDFDVLGSVDRSEAAFEDALLLWWPPPTVEGFETREIHAEDAVDQLTALINEHKM